MKETKMPRMTLGTCYKCRTKDSHVLFKEGKDWLCPNCAEKRLEALTEQRDDLTETIITLEEWLQLSQAGRDLRGDVVDEDGKEL